MNRLFRQPNQGLVGYVALIFFAVAYLSAMTVVLAPGTFVSDRASDAPQAATNP
jgi:hypothetical protein